MTWVIAYLLFTGLVLSIALEAEMGRDLDWMDVAMCFAAGWVVIPLVVVLGIARSLE